MSTRVNERWTNLSTIGLAAYARAAGAADHVEAMQAVDEALAENIGDMRVDREGAAFVLNRIEAAIARMHE